MKKGLLVVTEGLDGSGNGEIVRGLTEWANEKGFKIFDLTQFEKENHRIPLYEEIKDENYQVILSAEMGFCWAGAALRDELIRKNNEYSYDALSVAYAYALDREMRFKRLLGKFLNNGGLVFSQRSFVSSIVYQPIQAKKRDERLGVEEILNISGNRFVYENYSPDLLLITKCSADTAKARLEKREKQDNSLFEELNFQKELEQRYSSLWLKSLMENKGTKIHFVDTGAPNTPQDTRNQSKKIVQEHFDSNQSKDSL